MKRILKFFPVALAAFALASCSNDELFDLGGNDDFQKDPSKLYVTIEDLVDGENGTTRSGYVYNQDPLTNPNGQYFVWTAGDMVKLYDDVNNWRPQVWQYDEEATQKISAYSSAEGFAVFSQNVTETELTDVKKVDGAKYNNAYGVVPFNLSEFTNEQRTSIKFDFSPLQFYSLNREDVTDVYAKGKLAKAIIPLWGVANGNEMKVKYLSGILKVDMFNLAADNNEATHSFLIVQSTKGTKGVKMHPADLAEVGFQPDDDINKAPEISTEVSADDATVITTALNAVKIDGSYDVPEDLIIVDLGNAGERTCVAVPLLPLDGQKVKAFVAANVLPNTDGEYDLTAAEPIGQSKTTWDVTAGKYYRIMDNASYNVDGVNTLDELARKIKALDNQSDRALTMYLTDNVNVQGGDDPKGYTLTLLEGLKHDVTLTFAPGKGFLKVGTAHSLEIETLASEKSLTIVNTETDVATIEIKETAAGPIVLKGNLKNVVNNANDILTMATGATSLTSYGNLTINITPATDNITTFNLGRGTGIVKFLQGGIKTLDFVTTENKTVNADVTIKSEGRTRINTVNLFNLPHSLATGTTKYNDDAKLLFDSKITSGYFNTTATIVLKSDASEKIENAIVTAGQLSGYDGSINARLIGKFDMNGNKWTPLASSASVNGAAYIARVANHNADAVADDVNNATITGLIMDASANTGFFATLSGDKTIQDLTFNNVTVSGAVASNIGTIAGTIEDNSNVEIKNITVTGINFATTYTANENTIGGIVGKVNDVTTGNVSIQNVTTSGEINAYGSLGGIVGLVADKAKVTFGGSETKSGKKYAKDVCTSSVKLTEKVIGTESDPVYTKIGNLIGSIETKEASNVTNVIIYVSALPEARTFDSATADLAKWGFLKIATGRNTYKDITLNQNLIGLSGFYGALLDGDWSGFYGPKRCSADWYVTIKLANGQAADDKVYKYYAKLPGTPDTTYDKVLATITDAQ